MSWKACRGRFGPVIAGIGLLTLLFVRQAGAVPLADRVEAILDSPAAQRAFWGIKIVDLDTGSSVYERNPDKLFVPASNAKLFSAALGLARLGPDYRYTTAVVAEQEADEKGVIIGDIVFLGGGDPNLSSRVIPYDPEKDFDKNTLLRLSELARQVVQNGVRRIEGNLIGDDTRYIWQSYRPSWSMDDVHWGYGAPISALAFNDNLVEVRILPGRGARQRARVDVKPPMRYFSIDNQIRTVPTRTVARGLEFHREPGTRNLLLWGQIPIRSRGRVFSVAVDDPALFAALALRSELERLGVTVAGEVVPRHVQPHEVSSLKRGSPTGPKNQGLKLASIQSAPLLESLRVMNKVSQNLHAEMLLREVGYVGRGVGSFEAGLEELKEFLLEAGLKRWEFQMDDASGLSRKNLVSPAATVKLLTYMWNSAQRAPYLQSLPLAGEDGTLGWRFSRTPARGLIRAKTGSLAHTTALSGYAITQDRRNLAFSIFVNNYRIPGSYFRSLVDKICVEMIKSGPPSTDVARTAASREQFRVSKSGGGK